MGNKLDSKVVFEMKRMKEEGRTLQEIGERFGISRQRVCQIIKKSENVCEDEYITYTKKGYYKTAVYKKIRFVGLRNELEKREWSLCHLCNKAGIRYSKALRNFQLGTLPSNPDDINRIIKVLNSTYEKLFMQVDKDSTEQ